MSFLSPIRNLVRSLTGAPTASPPPPPPTPPPARDEIGYAGDSSAVSDARPAPAGVPAVGRTFEGHRYEHLMKLAGETATLDNVWSAERPLSEARNAHSTNTEEHMEEALADGYNWLEGDVRAEINSGNLEMRHDKGHESGDNLTLDEWLEIGKESGRGLKLDVKEGDTLPQILDQVEAAGIPDERLMLNIGESELLKYGDEIRQRFPDAIIAYNPPCNGKQLSSAEIEQSIAHAERFGQPMTFVARYDQVSDEAIERLQTVSPITVWNDVGSGATVEDPEALAADLRARGISGVIDIRKSLTLVETIEAGLEKGSGLAQDQLEKGKDILGDVVEDVSETGRDLWNKGADFVSGL